jgi:hypothetical protein
MGACARNMWSDSEEIKPAQCCIKLVFHFTYTMMHGSTKLKFSESLFNFINGKDIFSCAMKEGCIFYEAKTGLLQIVVVR